MNLDTVQYFLTLCEERNFTRAARRSAIAQPSLTVAIQRLEDRLGGLLFHRTRTSTSEPTDLALAIKPHFQRALRAWEQTRHVASEHRAANAAGSVGIRQVSRRKR